MQSVKIRVAAPTLFAQPLGATVGGSPYLAVIRDCGGATDSTSKRLPTDRVYLSFFSLAAPEGCLRELAVVPGFSMKAVYLHRGDAKEAFRRFAYCQMGNLSKLITLCDITISKKKTRSIAFRKNADERREDRGERREERKRRT